MILLFKVGRSSSSLYKVMYKRKLPRVGDILKIKHIEHTKESRLCYSKKILEVKLNEITNHTPSGALYVVSILEPVN